MYKGTSPNWLPIQIKTEQKLWESGKETKHGFAVKNEKDLININRRVAVNTTFEYKTMIMYNYASIKKVIELN